jgi:spore coat protein A
MVTLRITAWSCPQGVIAVVDADRTWNPSLSRRTFVRMAGAAGAGFALFSFLPGGGRRALAQLPGGTLDLTGVPRFATPVLIPPAMPRTGKVKVTGGKNIDYYEIAMRQFEQQMLPAGLPATTVWGYGPNPATVRGAPAVFHAPSLTIEAEYDKPVRIKWINELVDSGGRFLPHLLPVDPTLHWANPPGGTGGRDTRPTFPATPGRYTGPVPIVTHVHGAVGVGDESDGYTEAWYLPDATDIPDGYARTGTWYDFFSAKALNRFGAVWGPGFATFQYPNPDRASTNWYHDHALGMTRLNVYAGPAGFYLIRGGPSDEVSDSRTGAPAFLPGPAPGLGDPPGKTYREIPLAIQDRAFNADGSLFYPDTRAFFDGLVLDYIPSGEFSPIWNPEFFGNTIIVNGSTWPFLTVERRRYRLRVLNGCQSRFLILDFGAIPGVRVWVIGNEGGFLPAPVDLTGTGGNRLPMGPAERTDLIVDFAAVPVGAHVLRNLGPDEPYGGGIPGVDFDPADPETTGRIMQFRVVPAPGADPTTPPDFLTLPAPAPLPTAVRRRPLALLEKTGTGLDADGDEVEGPVEAQLGTVSDGTPTPRKWMDAVTEDPPAGDTEIWEFYNTTPDAHPMHIHEVAFEVVDRQRLALDADGEVLRPFQLDGATTGPDPWEAGVKDTVTAPPGQVTRVKARFDVPGQYVWHCHIVEHEDNEMMRPYRIGPPQPGQPR